MASFKHNFLKGMLNTLSRPMYWKSPPIDHLRSILEASTLMATLPWGVTFERIEFEKFDAEWLTPKNADGEKVLLYIHGGGYVIGSTHTHLLGEGYKPENVVIVGDSAGGGLAVALQLELVKHDIGLPLCSVLLSPYLDLTGKGKSIKRNAGNDRFLDAFEMRRWAELYAGDHDLSDPLISPLFGDFSGLSPILVQVSESEVLYNDSTRFVAKAKKHGVNITFQKWHGLFHWWHMFGGMPEAKEAIDKSILFIKEKYQSKRSIQRSIR